MTGDIPGKVLIQWNEAPIFLLTGSEHVTLRYPSRCIYNSVRIREHEGCPERSEWAAARRAKAGLDEYAPEASVWAGVWRIPE